MSDQTINQPHPSLKSLNARLEKLGRTIDQLDILAYRYQRLSLIYKQLAAQCLELSELLDQIDVTAFEVRQHYWCGSKITQHINHNACRHCEDPREGGGTSQSSLSLFLDRDALCEGSR